MSAERKTSGGRKHNAAQVAQRHEAVESVVRTGTMTRAKARALADEWGVTDRQVWRDRESIIRAWAAGLSREDRELRCARLLEETRALRSATAARGLSMGDGSLVRCAVELLKLERDLLGLATPTEVVVTIAEQSPTQLAADLADVLPFIVGMLDEDGRAVIDAAFTELPPKLTGA